MTLRQIVESLITTQSEEAQHLNFDELVKREKAKLCTCSGCGKAFKKQTSDPMETCFRCMGEEE